MYVRPLHDRILVQRREEREQHVGGIIIPDSAREKPQRGTVIAAGNANPTTMGSGYRWTPGPATPSSSARTRARRFKALGTSRRVDRNM
jgi:hypothetical protein